VRRAALLAPAVAMSPPAPADYHRVPGGRLRAWNALDQSSRIILRQIARRPAKAALTCLGIAFSVAILILPRLQVDAIRYLIDVSFGIAERQDLTVSFVEARSLAALYELQQVDGVLAAEPFRTIPARLAHGHLERREGLIGLDDRPVLSRPIDAQLRAIPVPDRGILLSEKLAELLAAQPGDALRVEVLDGRQPTLQLSVSGIAETFMGTPAYMAMDALNRALQEDQRISGAYLRIDPRRRDAVYRTLKDMPQVAGVALREASRQSFQETLDETVGTMTAILTTFACLIAVGVIYNNARVALAERAHELASLRVLGFTRREAAYILLGELGLLTVLALPLGAFLGWLLCWYLVQSFSSELFQVPLVIRPASFAYAALVVLLAATGSGLLVARDVRRLDLVSALKTRE
jgi:putative ABC transport system permease protein